MLTVLLYPLTFQDPEVLSRPFSCDAAFLPLRSFVRQLSQKTGLPFDVSPSIAERKIAISCTNRPVREVMDRVGEAMFMEWVKSRNGYSLRLSDEAKSEEALALEAYRAGRRETMFAVLEALIEKSAYTPEEIAKRRSDLLAYTNAHLLPSEQTTAEYQRALIYRAAYGAPFSNNLATISRGHTKQIAEILLSGYPIVMASERIPFTFQVPASSLNNLREAGGMGQGFSDFVGTVSLSSGRDNLLEASVLFRKGSTGATLGAIDLTETIHHQIRSQKLNAHLKAWEGNRDPQVLAKRLMPWKTPARQYTLDAISIGEKLHELSQRSGVPFVADAFRLADADREPISSTTVEGWLMEFNKARTTVNRPFRPSSIRTSNGWLMVRYPRYWIELVREIPEQKFEALDKVGRSAKGAGIDTLAAFAAGLSDEQIQGYRRGVLTRTSLDSLSTRFLLWFWSSLREEQRRIASQKGILAGGLSSSQIENLIYAMSEGLIGSRKVEAFGKILRAMTQGEPTTIRAELITPPSGATMPSIELIQGEPREIRIPAPEKTRITISTGDVEFPIEINAPVRTEFKD